MAETPNGKRFSKRWTRRLGCVDARAGGLMGKRGSFTMRVTDAMATELEQAAALSGRSVSEEIEYRLEKSVWLETLLGGPLPPEPKLVRTS